jgi:hypothetical protein
MNLDMKLDKHTCLNLDRKHKHTHTLERLITEFNLIR